MKSKFFYSSIKNNFNKRSWGYFLGSLFVFFIFFISSNFAIFADINNLILDTQQGQILPRSEIVIVGIDDKSLQEIGAWEWNREIFTKTIDKINEGKPKVIGFDILFLETRDGDDEFNLSIKNSPAKIVLGSKVSEENAVIQSVLATSSNVESGFVNFATDPDGKIRDTRVKIKLENDCQISFSYKIFREFLLLPEDTACDQVLNLRSKDFNLDDDYSLQFAYSNESFQRYSFSDVMNGEVPSENFENKIVLIGSTALDLRSNLNDNFLSVFGTHIPGVEIHANIVNSFLENTFYNPIGQEIYFANLALVSLIFISLLWLIRSQKLRFIVFVIFFSLSILAGLVLYEFNYLWNFVDSSLIIISLYIFSIIYFYYIQSQDTRFIKKAFGQYISPKLLHQLTDNPDKLNLGGELRNMTVMFSDLRGFTSMSESMGAERLVQLLNDYLNYMSTIVINNNGTIDKYIGDAIMAFWNAPLDDPEHQQNAIKTSLDMMDALKEFNKKYEDVEFKIGIGVNTGDMIVGNIGGENRFDYTVLGDTVNTASRLESLTKKYKTSLIVTESTIPKSPTPTLPRGRMKEGDSHSELKAYSLEPTANVIYQFLDEVRVKGKTTALKIYVPMRKTKENLKFKDEFEEALNIYRKGDFKKAKVLFEKIKDVNPTAELFLERIETFTPPKDWDGSWTWEEK